VIRSPDWGYQLTGLPSKRRIQLFHRVDKKNKEGMARSSFFSSRSPSSSLPPPPVPDPGAKK